MRLMGEGKGPGGNYRTGLTFQLKIKRSDYGMTFMQGPIGENVAITASFEGVRLGAQLVAPRGIELPLECLPSEHGARDRVVPYQNLIRART